VREWIIDAANTGGVNLFPDHGEYMRALPHLSDDVPDEVFLHLYAYEILERMREVEGGALVVPLWPSSVFEAAGSAAHAAREIEALFPPAEKVRYVPRDARVVAEAAMRFTGAVRFDPGRYIESVEREWGDS
jgi:hypothetical protein